MKKNNQSYFEGATISRKPKSFKVEFGDDGTFFVNQNSVKEIASKTCEDENLIVYLLACIKNAKEAEQKITKSWRVCESDILNGIIQILNNKNIHRESLIILFKDIMWKQVHKIFASEYPEEIILKEYNY